MTNALDCRTSLEDAFGILVVSFTPFLKVGIEFLAPD